MITVATFARVQNTHPVEISAPTEVAMRAYYAQPVDLSDCEKEPLHLIQVIQPHACLLVVDRDTYEIEVASENTADHIGRPWRELLGQPLSTCFDESLLAQIQRAPLDREQRRPLITYFEVGGETVVRQVLHHATDRQLILEVEPVQDGVETSVFQERLGNAIEEIQRITDYSTMFQRVTEVAARIGGYDRVSLYRFDREYNGDVIAEVIKEGREPWLNLRFPASDIPKQARDLYFRNRVRMLSDIEQPQVFLRRKAGDDDRDWGLDLSMVDCRGLSPIHKEYLQNVGVAASMSVAIVLDNKLWGLFAMHHDTPRFMDYELRSFLRFVGQVFSGHLALQAASEYRRRVLEVNVTRSRLGDQISELQDIGLALTTGPATVLDIVRNVQGAVVSAEGKLHCLGTTLEAAQLKETVEWIKRSEPNPLVYHSDKLCGGYDGAEVFREICAGMLLVWIDREQGEYIAWFREEIQRQLQWGGRPDKNMVATDDGGLRFAPRKSFAKYVQTVQDRCEPWTDVDIDAALALRSHIKDVVLRRYQQVKRVNSELATAYKEMESFSYTVSHDLRSPLRGINGFAEILIEDYADRLDDEGIDMLRRIQSSTVKMNSFIDDLLTLAKVGVTDVAIKTIDMGKLARESFEDAMPAFPGRKVNFAIAPDLPTVQADRQLMTVTLSNLIGNAIKYSANREVAEIEFGFDRAAGAHGAYYVKDNGEGFDQRYADRVFEMFTRLSENSEIPGSGVGLALVHRIILKHGGQIWVESQQNVGTVFYFALSVT